MTDSEPLLGGPSRKDRERERQCKLVKAKSSTMLTRLI